MKKSSHHVLRIGLVVTFLWIGVLILRQPEAWGGYLKPWAVGLLPVSVARAMVVTAVLDVAIGISLLIGPAVWIAAFIGAIHIALVLVVSGITDITVRDIAILAAAIALALDSLPETFYNKIKSLGNEKETNN